MNWAIFHHPDFAIALHDLSLDFANLFIEENRNLFLAAENRFTSLSNAVWTKRVRNPWPAQRRFCLLPRFQQRLVGPFRCEGCVRLIPVENLDRVEDATRCNRQVTLRVFN